MSDLSARQPTVLPEDGGNLSYSPMLFLSTIAEKLRHWY